MSKELTCIIVDDEPPAIRLLEKHVAKTSFLELKGTYTNPLEALQHIEKEKVNLVFLDIQMPEITGIQLSKIINKETKIIFTTAYPQFALESYDVSAIDYLLKPIEFDRFYKAVLKIQQTTFNQNQKPIVKDEFFFFKTDGKNNFSKVFLKDILYVEGLKNYVSIYLKDQRIITYSTIKNITKSLPKSDFIQIHKSYVISIKQIEKIDNHSVWINKKELPIGNTYRKLFFEKIADNQL